MVAREDLKKLQKCCEAAEKVDLYDLIGARDGRPGYGELKERLEKKQHAWSNVPDKFALSDIAGLALELLKNPEDQAAYDRFLANPEPQTPPLNWQQGGYQPLPLPQPSPQQYGDGGDRRRERERRDSEDVPAASTRTKGVAALLCIPGFFGFAGLHRFYVGKNSTGVLMFVTFGGLGVWLLIDLILILAGKFKDCEGLVVGASTGTFGYASQGSATGWQRFRRDASGYFRSLGWGFRLLLGVFGAALLLDAAACPFGTRSGSDAEAPVPMPASVGTGGNRNRHRLP